MKLIRKRIGDILLESKFITKEQLELALVNKKQNQKLGEALIECGFVTEQQLANVLAKQLNIPIVKLHNQQVNQQALKLVNKDFAHRHHVFPFDVSKDRLLVAMDDPMDFFVVEDLRMSTGLMIELHLTTPTEILQAIAKHYDLDPEAYGVVEEKAETPKAEMDGTNDAPVVRLVNQLIESAVTMGASDIHFDPSEKQIDVRFRVDGVLRTEKTLPKAMQNMITARIKIMGNLDITELRVPQDGRIRLQVSNQIVDLRLSTLPTIYGEKIVCRILVITNSLQQIDNLEFSRSNLNKFKELIVRPNGIILITGPTGSGKSSTLYAVLNELNEETVNIITVEDPVEYRLKGINQIQVQPTVGLTFAAGLRSILRQDPDIVMIGEIRDKETADIAVRASLTGHLVLSTLHTNDSISTVTRLLDMGIEPFLVASSVNGIVSQRLVRRICRDCKTEYAPSSSEIALCNDKGIQVTKLHRGKGCSACKETGYRGRLALQELLVFSEDMRRAISNGASFDIIKNIAEKDGLVYLIQDGVQKAADGLTTIEEVLRVAVDS
ncbi:MAG: GspE/PulE family protein [Bacilli bacterium]